MKLYLMYILAVSAMAGVCSAQTPAPTTAPSKQQIDAAVAVFAKPIEASSNDDALRQKLIERHNTAVRLLEVRIEGYRRGTSDAASVFEAARIAGDAKQQLAASNAQRIAAARQMLNLLKMAESRLEQEFQSGLISEPALLTARLAREEEEIELMNLEHADSKPATTRPQ